MTYKLKLSNFKTKNLLAFNKNLNHFFDIKSLVYLRENKSEIKKKDIVKINELSSQMAGAKSLKNFDRVLKEHESFVGQLMSIQPIKEKQFKDFSGEIKSLGAWGGDFIFATGDSNTPEYFSAKGFPTVFGYDELIL